MTEKTGINGKTGRWFWPLYLTVLPLLLAVLGGIAWWGFNKVLENQDELYDGQQKLENKFDEVRANQHEISFILYEDPDTKQEYRQRLDDIYSNTRGDAKNK